VVGGNVEDGRVVVCWLVNLDGRDGLPPLFCTIWEKRRESRLRKSSRSRWLEAV